LLEFQADVPQLIHYFQVGLTSLCFFKISMVLLLLMFACVMCDVCVCAYLLHFVKSIPRYSLGTGITLD